MDSEYKPIIRRDTRLITVKQIIYNYNPAIYSHRKKATEAMKCFWEREQIYISYEQQTTYNQ